MDDKVRHVYERKIKKARDNAQNCKKAIYGGIFIVAIAAFTEFVLDMHFTVYKVPAMWFGAAIVIISVVAAYFCSKKAAEIETEMKRLEDKTKRDISD